MAAELAHRDVARDLAAVLDRPPLPTRPFVMPIHHLLRLTVLLALCAQLATLCSCTGTDSATSAPKTSTEAATTTPKPFDKPFLNIAHRGGRALRPEHTLLAYEHGLAVGADVIEFDLHATKDGVIVAIHDATVDRTTDGKGLIRNMTWAQVQKLDAGYRFTSDGGKTFPYRGKDLRIPRLDDLLKRFAGVTIAVEIKQHAPSIVDSVVTQVEAAAALKTTVLAAFPDATIAAVRARAPTAFTALALVEMLKFSELQDKDEAAYKPPGLFIQAPFGKVTAALVARAHRFGMKVQPWTVNKVADMQALIALGVDGMFTDEPGKLAALVAQP